MSPTLRRLLALALLCGAAALQAAPVRVRVAVVTDGPSVRDVLPVAMIEDAVRELAAADVQIELPVAARYAGDGSLRGVDAALDRALAAPGVNVVVALGVIASHEAGQRPAPSRPLLAPLVVDPLLQGFPLHDGHSGRHNFSYVADFHSVVSELRRFQEVVGFQHVAALVDGALLDALPQLAHSADDIATELRTRISVVRAEGTAAAALAALPPEVDAVYVTPLQHLSEDELRELAQGLAARRLPSFSGLGRSDVEAGLLLTTGGAQHDTRRLARRVVLMIQRIAQGEDPAAFDVSFPTEQRLAINLRTASEIDWSPRWEDLADAEQIGMDPDAPANATPLTLIEAMRAALDSNPALAATRERVHSSAEDVRIARSNLLPSLSASAAQTRIDEDRASPLTQAETTTTAGLSLQQVIYSERAWAGYSISQSLYEASRQGQRQSMLDTLQSAASAYLDLLRAKSVEAVRRSNVEHTRQNLETSRVRETVGLTERSDYLRWVSQLARDKQALLASEATRRQAEAELMRVLHRPATSPFVTVESGLDDPLTLVSSPRTQAYIDTPARWAVFTDYAVHTALEHAPEIAQSEAVIVSNRRNLTSTRRAYYVPELSLVSSASRAVSRSGVGSTSVPGAPDEDSWSVTLQATLPLFAGRRRSAELAQAEHDLRASESDRDAAIDGVEARARVALHATASSYPSIKLSRVAADAANENLKMVTEAYARGAVTVTDLIDAQDSALSADLGAADAKYDFLVDFVNVLRAINEFDLLLDSGSRDAWYARVDRWFRDHPNSAPNRR